MQSDPASTMLWQRNLERFGRWMLEGLSLLAMVCPNDVPKIRLDLHHQTKDPIRKQRCLGWKCFKNTRASAKMINKCEKKGPRDSSISGADTWNYITVPANRLRQILHRRLRLGRDYDARPRHLHRWNQLTSEQFEWGGFDLSELVPSFLLGVARIITVQIRELEASADVRRGTHLSEGLSHIEPEEVSFSASSVQLDYNSTMCRLTWPGESWHIL